MEILSSIYLKIVKSHENQRISVFIDGPKNRAAIQLKDKILSYGNVSFVAVHDTYDGLSGEKKSRIFESSSNKKYNTQYFKLLNSAQVSEADYFFFNELCSSKL